VVIALDEIGEVALKRLRSDIGDPDADTRCGAVFALGEIEDEESTNALVAALKDENIAVRIEAANALGKLGDARTVASLLVALDNSETEVGLKRSVIIALGKIGDDRAVPFLVEELAGGEISIRTAAAKALGNIGTTAAVNPLLDLLVVESGADVSAAIAAISALGRIGDKRATKALIMALDNERLLLEAVNALGRIGDIETARPLVEAAADADVDARMAIDEALRYIGISDEYPEILSTQSLKCPKCKLEVTANNRILLYSIALIIDGADIEGSSICPLCRKEITYREWAANVR
jgi:HEAT repeat protein